MEDIRLWMVVSGQIFEFVSKLAQICGYVAYLDRPQDFDN